MPYQTLHHLDAAGECCMYCGKTAAEAAPDETCLGATPLRRALQRLASCDNIAPYEAGYINRELAARIEFARRVLRGDE